MVCCTQGLIKTRPVSVLELRLDSGSITVIPSDVKRDKTGLVTEMMVQAGGVKYAEMLFRYPLNHINIHVEKCFSKFCLQFQM